MSMFAKHARRLLPAAALSVAVASAGSAVAESTGSAAAESTGQAEESIGLVVEEIIVTATKRATGLQDVPIAITALSGAQLERVGATGFADFFRSAPGLTFNQTDPGTGNFSIRGVSTSVSGGNVQPTVALYIDELPTLESFGASTAPDLHLFDVERVEVLRGPQGTLFGSGSMGGAVRVITRKPQLNEFEGAFSGQLASIRNGDESYGANAMINLPLAEDRLALRVVGYYRDTGGYVDNLGVGSDSNRSLARGGRAALLFQPIEDLKLTATVTHQSTRTDDRAAYNATVNGKPARRTVLPEYNHQEITIGNLAAEYDFGVATLFSSTSYAETESSYQVDLASFFGTPGARSNTSNDPTAFAQELRLTSKGDGAFSWVAGAFYVDRDGDMDLVMTWPGAGAIFGPAFPSDDIYKARILTPAKEKALFGEISYRFNERWEATLGARWFENESTYAERTSGALNGGTTQTSHSTSQNKATPKVVLTYKPAADLMLYAQASQGYRVGQNNTAIPPDPDTGLPAPVDYKADTLWNYELGAKTSWLDDRLVLNGAVYYIDWSDIQLDLVRSDDFYYIANVGEAHSLGAELELTARVGRGLQLSTAVSVLEAEIDEDNAQLAQPVRKGDRMPGVPQFTVANAADYSFPLWGPWQGYVRLDHQYVGRSFDRFDRAASLVMGDYHLVNLRGGVLDERWEVALFVRNLLDDDDVMTAYRGVGPVRYLLEPRTVGVEFNARF